jgi:hypothetical protein
VRLSVCVLIALLVTACGSAEPAGRVERYGISLEVPDGWDGEISRGLIRIRRGDVSVELHEYETTSEGEAAYFDDGWPVRLEAADFRQQRPGAESEEDTRLVSVAGRLFSVFLHGDASAAAQQLKDLNEALAGIEVQAGDFYPGSVESVEFPERPGWHAVSSAPNPRYSYGEDVQTAAATIPYRDETNELPPHRTLEALPRDGIVVWVSLGRSSRFPPSRLDGNPIFEPRRNPPYRLADLERLSTWPGQIRDIPEYVLGAAIGDRYLLDLRVYFGRAQPNEAMLAEADAMLAGLRFPDWGPWELEPA